MPDDLPTDSIPTNVAGASATTMKRFLAGPWAEAEAILADLDGCLISGDTVLPGVAELMARASRRLWIVSNNSSDTALTLSFRLAGMGLAVAPPRILLAGEMTVRDLALTMPGARVALFAADPLRALACELGLRPCRGEPDAQVALLARDPGFSMADLAALMRIAHRGVPVRVTNPDPFHPAADGAPVPETGALFAALKAGVPGLALNSLGKPAPAMVEQALARAETAADRAVFLGDTDATDGAAARAAGVHFVLLDRPKGAKGC